MIDQEFFFILLGIWSVSAAGTFILLFFIPAPYGKLTRSGWGAQINSRIAWIMMELVSLAGMLLLFFTGKNRDLPFLFFFLFWVSHYSYRSLVFPVLNRKSSLKMPVIIMVMAFGFNLLNSFFNGFFLFHLKSALSAAWVFDIRFLLGSFLFVTGFLINIQSDHILRGLRKGADDSYRIPYGGLFRFISCPNYFGEIVEWTGWAIATWSLAGFSFALWTIANLAPRAFSYHAWYKKSFPEYPGERKALIPFLL